MARDPHPRNTHAVLSVTAAASSEEIARAYRRLVREHHPDAHPETEPDTTSDPGRDGRQAPGAGTLQAVVAAYRTLRSQPRSTDNHHAGAPGGTDNEHDKRIKPAEHSGSATRPPLLRVGPVRYHGRPGRPLLWR
jgi:curved DNA-binding protein CbpA